MHAASGRAVLAFLLLAAPAVAAQEGPPTFAVELVSVTLEGSHEEELMPGWSLFFHDFKVTLTIPQGYDTALHGIDVMGWNGGPILSEAAWEGQFPADAPNAKTYESTGNHYNAEPGETIEVWISLVNDEETGDDYWFAARAWWVDEATFTMVWGPLSEENAYYGPDTTAPAAIVDLEAISGEGQISLRWTATGDDGGTGKAYRYDVRCSRSPIASAAAFAAAEPLTGGLPLSPATAGANEVGTAFLPEGTWHVALRVRDDAFHWSPLSNDATATVLPLAGTDGTTTEPVGGSSSSGCSASAGAHPAGGLAVILLLLPLAWWFGGRHRRLAAVSVALASLACSLNRETQDAAGPEDPAITITPDPSTLAIYPASIAPAVGSTRMLTAVKIAPGGARSAVAATWTLTNPALATVSGSGTHVVVTGVAAGKTKVTAQVDGLTAEAVVDVAGPDPMDPGPIFGCSEAGAIVTRYPAMGSTAAPTELWRAPDAHWSRGMAFTMSRSGAALWIGAAAPADEEELNTDCERIYRYDLAAATATHFGTLGGNLPSMLPPQFLRYRGFDSAQQFQQGSFIDRVFTVGTDRLDNGGGRYAQWSDAPGTVTVESEGYYRPYADIAVTTLGPVYYLRDVISTEGPAVYRGNWKGDAGQHGYPEYVSIPGTSMLDLAEEGAASGIAADESRNVYIGGRKSGRVWRYHDANGVGLAGLGDVVLFGSLTNSSETSLVVNGITTTKNGGLLVNVVQGSAAVPAGIYFMIDLDADGHVDPDLGEVIRYSPHPVLNEIDGGCIVAPR